MNDEKRNDEAEEQRGFEVVDKRGQRAEPAAEPTPEAAINGAVPIHDLADEAEDEDEDYAVGGEGVTGEMPGLAVADILRMSAGMLNEKAWIHLGLVADPLSGRIDRNLPEARRAIDALVDIGKHLTPVADEGEKRELQVMISNLRLNFVQQSNKG